MDEPGKARTTPVLWAIAALSIRMNVHVSPTK
jgi:hypothetical protein